MNLNVVYVTFEYFLLGKYEEENLTCELGVRNRLMGRAVVKERNQNNTSNHLLFMGTLLLHNNYYILNGLLLTNKSRATLYNRKKYLNTLTVILIYKLWSSKRDISITEISTSVFVLSPILSLYIVLVITFKQY